MSPINTDFFNRQKNRDIYFYSEINGQLFENKLILIELSLIKPRYLYLKKIEIFIFIQ